LRVTDQREKGKGFFARFRGGSQPAPPQDEKPVEET
jgi:fused signal recognition particle receptor